MSSRRFHAWAALLPMTLVLAVPALTPLAAGARTRGGAPTARQIRRAVIRAERSRQVWATVNVCDTRAHPDVMGVRGQMPALGVRAELAMAFSVEYFVSSQRGFRRLPGVRLPVSVGPASRGNYQAGAQFRFAPHTGLLRGRVRFSWRIGRRTVGTIERVTRFGHPDARYGDPARFSDWKCVIP